MMIGKTHSLVRDTQSRKDDNRFNLNRGPRGLRSQSWLVAAQPTVHTQHTEIEVNTVRDILDVARRLSENEREHLIQELLQVLSDRPLHVALKECRQVALGRFRHVFAVTNWTDTTIIVNGLVDWLKDAEAGTIGHEPVICMPKSTLDLQLEFGFPEVTIKLRGYILPSDMREAIVSQ
jgi:hypothetical protein